MHRSIHELADTFRDQVNSGQLNWSDYLVGPLFPIGRLIDLFRGRLAENAGEYLEAIANWGEIPSWTNDQLELFAEGKATPSDADLKVWANWEEVEPDWLLWAALKDHSGPRGVAILIENVPFCDGGPLFETISTFTQDQLALDYLKNNYE
jgi:hypothetical protein